MVLFFGSFYFIFGIWSLPVKAVYHAWLGSICSMDIRESVMVVLSFGKSLLSPCSEILCSNGGNLTLMMLQIER